MAVFFSSKRQRLRFQFILAALSLGFVSVIVAMFFVKETAAFYLTPTNVISSSHQISKNIRVGGFVKEGSIVKKSSDSITFLITDFDADVRVYYTGIIPDLFQEEKGVVVEGILQDNFTIEAYLLLAKHDENYIPKEVERSMNKEKLKKNILSKNGGAL